MQSPGRGTPPWLPAVVARGRRRRRRPAAAVDAAVQKDTAAARRQAASGTVVGAPEPTPYSRARRRLLSGGDRSPPAPAAVPRTRRRRACSPATGTAVMQPYPMPAAAARRQRASTCSCTGGRRATAGAALRRDGRPPVAVAGLRRRKGSAGTRSAHHTWRWRSGRGIRSHSGRPVPLPQRMGPPPLRLRERRPSPDGPPPHRVCLPAIGTAATQSYPMPAAAARRQRASTCSCTGGQRAPAGAALRRDGRPPVAVASLRRRKGSAGKRSAHHTWR